MGSSRTLRRLAITWAVLLPVLLVVTFIFSPGVLFSVIAAAVISPMVHSAVGLFYRDSSVKGPDYASQIFGGR